MMGERFTRNMYSRLQGIKYCTKKCHLVGTFLKLIHDARTDEHKKVMKCISLQKMNTALTELGQVVLLCLHLFPRERRHCKPEHCTAATIVLKLQLACNTAVRRPYTSFS
jgi:hypothetical protein